ncbi:hypothetical protein FC99_GL001628 [Levilactobacillus koreensis JCM 16448]|nr:hypothetical protein FC99_GL001628 [Levilactobacillus koreensis JCM 16448]
MYDLSVLGQLMDQTMTEYQLRKALRTKKWAEITPRGRLHFHKLVLEPVAINK